MKVLGPAIIDHAQQREMEKGSRSIFIGRDRLFPDAAARAKAGDRLWVKEPYIEVETRPNCPNIREMLPGSVLGVTIPDHIKPHWELLKKTRRPDAFGLRRGESRATLVIVEARPSGFLCDVVMENVDALLKREAA